MHEIDEANLTEQTTLRTVEIREHPGLNQTDERARKKLVRAHCHSLHLTVIIQHGDGTHQKQETAPLSLQRKGKRTQSKQNQSRDGAEKGKAKQHRKVE